MERHILLVIISIVVVFLSTASTVFGEESKYLVETPQGHFSCEYHDGEYLNCKVLQPAEMAIKSTTQKFDTSNYALVSQNFVEDPLYDPHKSGRIAGEILASAGSIYLLNWSWGYFGLTISSLITMACDSWLIAGGLTHAIGANTGNIGAAWTPYVFGLVGNIVGAGIGALFFIGDDLLGFIMTSVLGATGAWVGAVTAYEMSNKIRREKAAEEMAIQSIRPSFNIDPEHSRYSIGLQMTF